MEGDRLVAWTYYDGGRVDFEIVFPANIHTHAEAAAICAKYSCGEDGVEVSDLTNHTSVYGVKTQIITEDGTRHRVFDHEVTVSLQAKVNSLRNDK
jgi:hypothetical protein